MKWSTFLIIGVAILVVIIGWRGTQDAIWKSVGGTVKQTQKKPVSLFPSLSTKFTPAAIPSIPSILSNPILLQSNSQNVENVPFAQFLGLNHGG